jgi:plastocyanin
MTFPVALLYCSGTDEPAPVTGGPMIQFTGGPGEYRVKVGDSVTLTAAVENAVDPVYSWKVGGKIVATGTEFTFAADKAGEYFVNFRVDAGNGSAEEQVMVAVVDKLPPQVVLERLYPAFVGTALVVDPAVENPDGTTFSWSMDGNVLGTGPTLTFTPTTVTKHDITWILSDEISTTNPMQTECTANLIP